MTGRDVSGTSGNTIRVVLSLNNLYIVVDFVGGGKSAVDVCWILFSIVVVIA